MKRIEIFIISLVVVLILLTGCKSPDAITILPESKNDLGTVIQNADINLANGTISIGNVRFILINSRVHNGKIHSYYPIIVKNCYLIDAHFTLTNESLPSDWDSEYFAELPIISNCILENVELANVAFTNCKFQE